MSAMRLIVRRHNQRLYRVARAIVRDDTEAKDAMQDARDVSLGCEPFDMADPHCREQGG